MPATASHSSVVPFADLLDSLRRQGFSVGVDHYVRIYALLERVGDECTPQQLKTLLCPLVATSKEQQEQFYRTFDQQFGIFHDDAPGKVADEAEALPITTALGAAASASPLPEAPPDTASTSATHRRRWLTVLILGAIAVLVLIARMPSDRTPEVTAPADDVRPTAPETSGAVPRGTPAPEAIASAPDSSSPRRTAPSLGPTTAPSSAPRERRDWLPFGLALLILPVLAWGIYEWLRIGRSQLALRRERTLRPPYTWPVRVPVVRQPYGDTAELAEAARVVRSREASESQRLAIDASIAATIAAHGMPTLRYRSDTRPPDYLMLIERTCAEDHHARLFTDLGSSLVREGVHITRYYYDGDPRVCFSESDDEAALLTTLRHRFPSHRLLMFGFGERFVDPVSMTLHSWVETLMDWRSCVLLTPEPVTRWGMREQVLSRCFLVMPASIDGLRAAAELLMTADQPKGSLSGDDGKDAVLPVVTGESAASVLREYLPDDVFQWLCACAIYPELNWSLTLFIGSLPCMGEGLVTEANLLRLIRLPWFRKGVIPDDVRFALINALPLDVSRAVREELVQLLEQHPPPVDSVAAPRHQLNIAMQRLLSGAHDAPQRQALVRALDGLQERELLQDRVYIRLLEQDRNGALATLLPRRLRKSLHRRGAPAFGTVRIALVGTAAAVLLLGVTASWLGNRALAARLADAARGVADLPVVQSSPGTIAFPSPDALRRLDMLRAQLDTVRGYVNDGPPLRLRFGLWRGQALIDAARPVWYEGFRRQLFATAWGAIVDSLKALPDIPTTSSDYGVTYAWLKSYLITTTAPDSSTVPFLAPVLLTSWQRGQKTDEDVTALARRQFEFYASELPAFNPFPTAGDAALVRKAREFLGRFTGGEQIYRNMVAAADKAVPPVRVPQTPGILTTTPEVPGAFSAKGASFMADVLRNADPYFRGESWVVGDAATSRAVDREAVIRAIRTRYFQDYTHAWLQVLQGAVVASPANVKNAADKLAIMSGTQSPILQVLRTVAVNTSGDSAMRAVFQPVHAVTPPEVLDKFVSEKNRPYMEALLGLAGSLRQVSMLPAPADTQPTLEYAKQAQAAGSEVTKARVAAKRVAQGFTLKPDAVPVASAVEQLLVTPINGAEAVLVWSMRPDPVAGFPKEVLPVSPPERRRAQLVAILNERGRALCGQMTPILAKFPFNPDATSEASIAEVTALLAPGTGAIWAFQQERLDPFLDKQGGKWVAKRVPGVALSATFVEFFNRASQVSAALFPNNAPTPTLRWMARGITSSQTPLIVLKHGGREARFDARTPRNEIVWPAESGRSASLEATFQKNKPFTVASANGEWALFRLVAQAARFEGAGHAEWSATGKDAVPVVVEFDAPDGLPVLKRGWLGGMTCVAQVTQ